ncbi:MAG: hypothetical protein KH359_01900 [Clostridiales bacterium]|nr:hypothetical protein [Clostridiales bacterium]
MTAKEKLRIILSSPVNYIQSFMTIVNKQGKKVPFKLNEQQLYLLKNLDKYNIILKSRQLGISAISCGYSLFIAMTEPDSHCMLISYSLDSADAIYSKLKQLYNDLPNAIKVKDIANNKKELRFENGSKITVATMGNKDIARGSTLRFVHLSELAFMKSDNISKQLLALEQALAPKVGQIVIESTANGLNEFSTMWEKSENKENLYKPFFFSWIDDKVMFKEEYAEFVKRYKALHGAELTLDELDEDEQTYYKMGASLEQLMWRRIKIMNSSESQFRQEFPATPMEAFVTSGNNIFNSERVQKEYNRVKLVKTINSLIPTLKVYKNYIKLWKAPERGMKYYIGVDASEGIGQDFSVISVYDEHGFQCMEFRSNKIQPHKVAEICNEIGLWFNRGLMVVEKASGGNVILDRLKHTYKYMNLYKHKDYDKVTGRTVKKIGWVTTNKSKPLLINDFIEWWENDDITINSTALLSEMKVYQYTDGRMNAQNGYHDDTVIASSLAVQGIKSGIYYR